MNPLGVRAASSIEPARTFEAVGVLRAEHREMERLLSALDGWAEKLATDTQCDPRADAARFVGVLRAFIADFHHAREEGVLFHVLELACASREHGPLVVLTHEHQLLDGLIAELDRLASRPQPWGAVEREQAHDAASTYADLLRRHIIKEEAVVYPMAEALLTAEAKAEIDARLEAFARSEGEQSLEGLRQRSAALVADHARSAV